MILPIVTDESILRATNTLATAEEIPKLIKTLEESLRASPHPGVGLSAPQVGINKCVAIVRTKEVSFNLANPVILDKLGPFINKNEGCLSIPGKTFDTQRYNEIFVKDDLHPAGLIITGLESVVVQHETDHLCGMLVKDRAIGKNKVRRNDSCPCGKKIDGKPIKYKKCHGR